MLCSCVIGGVHTLSSVASGTNQAPWLDASTKTPCSKILIVSPISSPSHNIAYLHLANGLANRCHSVDLIVSHDVNVGFDHPNVTKFTSPLFQRLSEELFTYKLDELPPFSTWVATYWSFWLMGESPRLCSELLSDEVFKRFVDLPDDHYDMVLVTSHIVDDCALAFAHKARKGDKLTIECVTRR